MTRDNHDQATAMRTFVRMAATAESPAPVGRVWLSYQGRCVSRQRVRLEDGTEAGLILPRGTRLKDGDVLIAGDGSAVLVRALREELSLAVCPTPRLQARVAYHLGNRHAAVMLEEAAVTYPADPVLDQMVTGMGVTVRRVMAPFQPESGAYDFTPGDALASLLSTPPAVLRAGRTDAAVKERRE